MVSSKFSECQDLKSLFHVHSNKFPDTLLHLRPRKRDMWIFFSDTFRNRNTFSVVVLINSCPDYDRIRTAPTVFIFQEVGIFFCRKAFFKMAQALLRPEGPLPAQTVKEERPLQARRDTGLPGERPAVSCYIRGIDVFIIQYIRAGCKRKTRAGQCGKQHGVKNQKT